MKYLNSLAILFFLAVTSVFFVSCEDDAKVEPDEIPTLIDYDLIGCWKRNSESTNVIDPAYYKFEADGGLYFAGEEERDRFLTTWSLSEDGTKIELINQEHEVLSVNENEIVLRNIPLDEIDTLVRSDCPDGIDDDFILEKEDLLGCWKVVLVTGGGGGPDYFLFTEEKWIGFLGEYAIASEWTFSDSLLVSGGNTEKSWRLTLLENDVMKLKMDEDVMTLYRSDECPEFTDAGISEEELIGCWYSQSENNGTVYEIYYNFKEGGEFVRNINGDSQTEYWSLSDDGKYISMRETDPPAMVKSFENGVLVLVMIEEGKSYSFSFEKTENCPEEEPIDEKGLKVTEAEILGCWHIYDAKIDGEIPDDFPVIYLKFKKGGEGVSFQDGDQGYWSWKIDSEGYLSVESDQLIVTKLTDNEFNFYIVSEFNGEENSIIEYKLSRSTNCPEEETDNIVTFTNGQFTIDKSTAENNNNGITRDEKKSLMNFIK